MEEICVARGVTCSAVLVRVPADMRLMHNHIVQISSERREPKDPNANVFEWSVVLGYQGRVTGPITFKCGRGWRKPLHGAASTFKATPPNAASVLSSLIGDSICSLESFEDFCAELGYDTDSRKALATYLACQESGAAARKLLMGDFDLFASKGH